MFKKKRKKDTMTKIIFWNVRIYIMVNIALLSNIVMPQTIRKCEPVLIKFCRERGYANTTFPNLADNYKQEDALWFLKGYVTVITSNCSDLISDFLCSVYTPFCDKITSNPIGPCRPLCIDVKRNCQYFYDSLSTPWPKDLNCKNFPYRKADSNNCIDVPRRIGISTRNETIGEKRLQKCMETKSCTLPVSDGTVIRELFCIANCFPECKYQWLRNNEVIRNSSTLSLGPITQKMNGTYTCRATNMIGQTNHSFIILHKPAGGSNWWNSGEQLKVSVFLVVTFVITSISALHLTG